MSSKVSHWGFSAHTRVSHRGGNSMGGVHLYWLTLRSETDHDVLKLINAMLLILTRYELEIASYECYFLLSS